MKFLSRLFKPLLLSILGLATLLSCVSISASVVSNSSEEIHSSESEIPEVTSMSDLPWWIYDSTPKNGHPRIVTFATRRFDRDEEIETAAQLASLELARYQGLFVSAKELSQKGNANFGYAHDINISYNKELALEYLDELEIDQALRTPEGTFVRFTINSISTNLNYSLTSGNPPSWITDPPEIPGYRVSVGFVQRHRNWAASAEAADESAIEQLAFTLFGKVINIQDSQERSSQSNTRSSSLGTIYLEGEGTIKKLQILSRWEDPKGNFYSLAVIPAK